MQLAPGDLRPRCPTGSRVGRTGPPRGTSGQAPSAFALPTPGLRVPGTRTASSRYACATRTGEARTPARLSTGCHSINSALPGSPYQERPSAWSASSSRRYRPSGASRPASAVSARSAARASAASRPPGVAGRRLSSRPALEQPAEGERGDLACAQLRDEPLGGRALGGVVDEQVGPARLGAKGAHREADRRSGTRELTLPL